MLEQTVYHPPIGEIHFVSSAGARNIRISLKPFGGVKVSVPRRVSVAQAMRFVTEKIDWILQAQAKIAQQESTYTIFTPETIFATDRFRLRLLPWKSEKFRVQTTKAQLQIFYPQGIDLLTDKAQATIRKHLLERLRTDAKEHLPARTEVLAVAHGLSYCGVSVKLLASRWGSCSSVNHINLNILLMRLPAFLQDYVILHELVHTVHKNHSANFWKCLDQHTDGKAKQLSAEMRRYHTGWL